MRRITGWSAVVTAIVGGTLVVGFLDWLWLHDALRQAETARSPIAVGVIVHSSVNESCDSDGCSYRADVRYRYNVDDRWHESSRRRFSSLAWSSKSNAQQMVDAHPVGSSVNVYYQKARPSEAVIEAGLAGEDLLLPLLLLPFNLLALGAWAMAGLALCQQTIWASTGGVRVVYAGTLQRIRLPQYPPAPLAMTLAATATLVGVFAIGIPTGFRPSMALATNTWSVIIGAAALLYLSLAMRVWAGRADLLIDPLARRLTLPATFGRGAPVTLSFADVTGIDVETKKSGGDAPEYEPTVSYTDATGSERTAVLASWDRRARADAFATWLRKRFNP